MHYVRLFCLCIMIAMVSSCRDSAVSTPPVLVSIVEEKEFDSIPSGSGMVLKEDFLFIISDDAPFVYRISLKNDSIERTHIEDQPLDVYRIEKENKPDFESATMGSINGEETLFAFGSGSKSPLRDLVLLSNDTAQQVISLTAFYKDLQKQTSTTPELWNLEGSAIIGDSLYLLNRGNNMIIAIQFKSFTDYLFKKAAVPAVKFSNIIIPKLEGQQAKLSGMCETSKTQAIVCASIEDTQDSYNDGEVLGSYICILDLGTRMIQSYYLLTDSNGKALKQKLESVELLGSEKDGRITVIAIADNDDGKTKFFKMEVDVKD